MDQTIARIHLDLMLTLIVVILQLLVMMISAQLINLVKWMKVTVISMMNAKAISFVDQTIVQIYSSFYLQLIAVNLKVMKYYTYYISSLLSCNLISFF